MSGAETTARYARAAETEDLEGLLATMAPDVVVHSPITDRFAFKGHDDLRELMPAVWGALKDIRYTDDVGDERTRALFYRARVRGKVEVEEATLVRLNDDGLISEITLWYRPLPGLTAFVAALAPLLGRQRGPAHAAALRAFTAPLAAITKAGDRVAVRLVREKSRRGDSNP